MAGLGSLVTVALGLIGYFQAQGTRTREAIEAGDKAVREAEGKARHDLTNRMQATHSEMRRHVEQLQRDSYRRDEARDLKNELTMTVTRIEGKVDQQANQLAELLSLKASLNYCVEQVRDVAHRISGARP
jgi:chromosome segregation ATPase